MTTQPVPNDTAAAAAAPDTLTITHTLDTSGIPAAFTIEELTALLALHRPGCLDAQLRRHAERAFWLQTWPNACLRCEGNGDPCDAADPIGVPGPPPNEDREEWCHRCGGDLTTVYAESTEGSAAAAWNGMPLPGPCATCGWHPVHPEGAPPTIAIRCMGCAAGQYDEQDGASDQVVLSTTPVQERS